MNVQEIRPGAIQPSMTVEQAARLAAQRNCELRVAWNGTRCFVELVPVDHIPRFIRAVQSDAPAPEGETR